MKNSCFIKNVHWMCQQQSIQSYCRTAYITGQKEILIDKKPHKWPEICQFPNKCQHLVTLSLTYACNISRMKTQVTCVYVRQNKYVTEMLTQCRVPMLTNSSILKKHSFASTGSRIKLSGNESKRRLVNTPCLFSLAQK